MSRTSTRRSVRSATLVALSVFVLASLGPGADAAAEHKPTGAVKAWKRGRALFESGKHHEALEQFAIGYRVSGRGGFLFNMAECARLAGDAKRARELYRQYLARFPKGSQVAKAKKRCAGLQAGNCEPGPPPASTSAPAPAPPKAARAETAKKATAPTGDPWSEPWANKATAGQARPVPLVPARQPVAAKSTSRPFYEHWGFWTGVGAVLVAGGVTAIVLATRGDDGPGSAIPVVDFRD